MTEYLEPSDAGRADSYASPDPNSNLMEVRRSSSVDPLPDPVHPDIRWREILSILALVALADITIFRGTGYAGGALLLLVAPFLLVIGSPAPKLSIALSALGMMAWATAARLIWQGSAYSGFAGFLVVTAFAMALSGRTPFILELLGYICKSWIDAIDDLGLYDKWLRHRFRFFPKVFSLQWILPLIAVVVFSGLFVAANPDLARDVGQSITRFLNDLGHWLETFSSSPMEVAFCIAMGWYVVGILRPSDWSRELDAFSSPPEKIEITEASAAQNSSMFSAFRNTIIAVSVLFAAYLVFEFQTLWFRKFPKGFHYSGYAHEGAFWLTVALALATVVLSVIFRGSTLQDSRLPTLRRWTWLWSVENFVLALAVYNRILIYVGFNGMTRMRVVAFLGISSVVVGFLLVLWKIAHNRGFLWLLRRQILTVTLAAYLYVVTPVDWLVYTYNVRRILAGDPAPAVQITEHEVSPEGLLTLPPLLFASDPIIRDGIRSMLTDRAQALAAQRASYSNAGWTSYQMVHDRLAQRLSYFPEETSPAVPEAKRSANWERFRQYVYQWY
ncbi:MAG: hypothetical protein JWN70_5180 [Planctomycetaceae bacterium]|nr:hypothetical protein [Planctomycetaceae bacterium]